MELSQFADVRKSLEHAIGSIEALGDKDLKAHYESELVELAQSLRTYEEGANETEASAINQRIGRLRRMGQAGSLVQQIRQAYSLPNLFVQASGPIVGAGIQAPLDDVGPIQDVILGTCITGCGHTVGGIDTQLVPSAERGAFDIVLAGTTASNTVAYATAR